MRVDDCMHHLTAISAHITDFAMHMARRMCCQIKKRFSPFYNTELATILSAQGITHIVVAGRLGPCVLVSAAAILRLKHRCISVIGIDWMVFDTPVMSRCAHRRCCSVRSTLGC